MMNNSTAISNSFGKSYFSKSNLLQQINTGNLNWSDLDVKAREELVKMFSQKVLIIAKRLKSKLPQQVDINDLLSAGSIGLLESLNKFDPRVGVKLESYVEGRIKGAMLDELRRQDWLSRGLRQNIRLIEHSSRSFENEKGRQPTNNELLDLTGLSTRELDIAQEANQKQFLLSLDNVESYLSLDDNKEKDSEPYLSTLFQELIERMADFIDQLTQREQLVLSLYYKEELTMKETAEVMDITEGRVSQLHNQALQKLRQRFQEEEIDDKCL